jgi:membrane protease YdiL (CAAX protease family)
MDPVRIDIKTLCVSLIAVVFTEFAVRPLIPENPAGAVSLVGIIRIFQAVLLLWIVSRMGKGLQNIGILSSRIFPGFKKGLIWSAGFGGVVLILGVILVILGIQPFHWITISLPPDKGYVFLLFCIGGIVGPITEEIFFRGILYGFLRQWGVFLAIFLSTSLFVFVHGNTIQGSFPQIIGGIVFALAYEIEKNLMVPVVIHITGNLAMYTLSLLF